jgi:hypothetical protein
LEEECFPIQYGLSQTICEHNVGGSQLLGLFLSEMNVGWQESEAAVIQYLTGTDITGRFGDLGDQQCYSIGSDRHFSQRPDTISQFPGLSSQLGCAYAAWGAVETTKELGPSAQLL